MNYWGYLIGYGYLAMLICIAELLSRHTNIRQEIIRKVLHCLIGLEWLVLYYCFADSWQIVVIPISFVIVNTLSYRFKFFRSIEREQNNHIGTIYYALAMTGMSIAVAIRGELMLPFGVAVACLSFGDSAASIMGQYLKPKVAVFRKTVWGVAGCFFFSLVALVALFALLGQTIRLEYVVAIAVVATLSEVISNKGTDNIFICLWCFVWCYALYLNEAATRIVLMAFVGFLLAGVAANTRAFTLPASIFAGIMLALFGIFGGWFAFLFVLGAYGVIYVTEHLIKRQRYKETRKVVQILENGLAAIALMIAYYATSRTFLMLAYVVAITQSLADSFASVVGTAYARNVYDIVTRRPVAKGLSGGVSVEGTVAALAVSALSMVVCGLVFGWNWYLAPLAALPFLGTLLDSVLGATIQYKQRCTVCGEVVECTAHCSRPTVPYSGHPFFTNGRVNLITNLLTTGVAIVVFYFAYPL